MSFQAMTWAIEQRTGSPRSKCVLWSIANYAGPLWFAYPKQDLIAQESEQSVDSVQKYLSDLIAAGVLRRVKLKRFGRRTHDFLILQPSPLYSASIEDILPHLPSGCDVMDDATATDGSVQSEESQTPPQDSETDATATGGSVSGPTLPPPAVDAADLQRQPMEPVMNQESLTQTLPQEKEAGEEGDPETWKRFERFKQNYPIPIFDSTATVRWFEALSSDDQELALIGEIEYGRECERLKRRPKDAHKFLRDRIFVDFANRAKGTPLNPNLIAADSEAGRAVIAIHAVARITPSEMSSGEIVYSKPITPQLRALASAPPRRDWRWIDDNQQIGAWHSFVRETITKARPEFVQVRDGRRGIFAPWPWPPRKDGTLSSTGPPGNLLMSEADMAVNL